MNSINKAINQFNSISLEEMDNVKLLDRVDTKFVCSIYKLSNLLQELSKTYNVLEIDGQRIMPYKTKYYDTYDFKMYKEHQNGKLNRYKVREREYVNSELNFLEIKLKNNKNRTLKSRIEKPINLDWFSNAETNFLDCKSPFSPEELEVKLYNTFNRITLSNQTERVTIDFNIRFEDRSGIQKSLPYLAIIEIKQTKNSVSSDIIKILKNHRIRPCGFSKYCVGASLIYSNLKSNRFKSKLLLISKLSA